MACISMHVLFLIGREFQWLASNFATGLMLYHGLEDVLDDKIEA